MANNLKLADLEKQPHLDAEIGGQLCLYDLVGLENSKQVADSEAQLATDDAKGYGDQMSDYFSNQMVRLLSPAQPMFPYRSYSSIKLQCKSID